MNEKIDFNIEDMVKEEVICNINTEKIDISSLPLINGDANE